ncbi:MAG: hypothetical protein V1839_02515 [archaeon]
MVKLKLLKGVVRNLADSFSSSSNMNVLDYVNSLPKQNRSFDVDILRETISPGGASLRESVARYKRWFLKNLKNLKVPEDEVVSVQLKIDISYTKLSQNWRIVSTVKTKEGKEFSDELRVSNVR